ncbi:hypothetical protein [Flavobacterium orientale]|uniref:Uncharacterized protein n=1 Tax=Flavobacterium orientale TaxID=1756020 RepID=A0A917DBM5_9FLAO|nr:hypothetical protein [Flavobacterium orientale]GGD24087.1 hypothetical protein GCM10011343_12830 [Flavobacterium orientale]
MKQTYYILIIFCFGFKFADYNCEFKDGKYKVIYDKQFENYPAFEFEVNGQNVTETNSDSQRKFKMESIGKNAFQLNSLEKQTDSLTKFQKALASQGQAYYEITNCKEDTIDFTLRVNLHVISYSGKFIRIK